MFITEYFLNFLLLAVDETGTSDYSTALDDVHLVGSYYTSTFFLERPEMIENSIIALCLVYACYVIIPSISSFNIKVVAFPYHSFKKMLSIFSKVQ